MLVGRGAPADRLGARLQTNLLRTRLIERGARSNQRTRFRKPLLYPLSYGGSAEWCQQPPVVSGAARRARRAGPINGEVRVKRVRVAFRATGDRPPELA